MRESKKKRGGESDSTQIDIYTPQRRRSLYLVFGSCLRFEGLGEYVHMMIQSLAP